MSDRLFARFVGVVKGGELKNKLWIPGPFAPALELCSYLPKTMQEPFDTRRPTRSATSTRKESAISFDGQVTPMKRYGNTSRLKNSEDLSEQMSLALSDGWHVGPLFIPQIKKVPVRGINSSKAGTVHRQQTQHATPKWADRHKIAEFYREAKRLTRLTGELHVVDHTVPKISDLVCGLHVEHNLQVIHWRENTDKSNIWWPGMWMEQQGLF